MGRENAVYEKFRKDYPVLSEQPVWEAFELLLKSCRNGGKILVCGNGGSASDSEHIVGELMKGFLLKRELPDRKYCGGSKDCQRGDLSRAIRPKIISCYEGYFRGGRFIMVCWILDIVVSKVCQIFMEIKMAWCTKVG